MRFPFRKRPKKNRSPVKKILTGLLLIPAGILLACIIGFFCFDDFMILFLSAGNVLQGNSNREGYDYSYIPEGWDRPFPTQEWQGSVPSSSSVPGSSGLQGMYINSISAGYYKEYLQIIRDHCNWTYMPDEVKPLEIDGEPAYPSISLYLGLQMSEGGLEPVDESVDGVRIAPYSTMKGKSWTQDGKHTLSTYNSAVVSAENGVNLPGRYRMDMCFANHEGYITHFQMKKAYMALAPSGRLNATGSKYPSKMNGYGIADGTVRDRSQSDAAYYPDLIASAIQMSWIELRNIGKRTFDPSDATVSGLMGAACSSYGYGAWGWESQYGMGYALGNTRYTANGWNSRNTVTYSQAVTKGLEWINGNVDELLNALATDYEGYVEGLWDVMTPGPYDGSINHEDYMGMFVFSTLYHGGFTTAVDKDNILGAGDSFYRGATIAYRALTKDKTKTIADTRAWVSANLKVKDISSTYPGYVNNREKKPYLYVIDSTLKIVPDAGGTAEYALHAYSGQARTLFMWRIGGVVEYHRMLNACGVEVSFADALADANGEKFVDFPNGSYYYGTRAIGNFVRGSDGNPAANLPRMTSAMHDRYLVWSGGSSIGIHYGEDYGAAHGTTFIAIADGTVAETFWNQYRGNVEEVVVSDMYADEDQPKIVYQYQHLSSYIASKGDTLKQGDPVGLCGSTGNSTGAHMHLNFYVFRGNTNRYYYLPYRAIFEGKCAIYNAPAVINGAQSAPGYVYGMDTTVPFGNFDANSTEDRAVVNNKGSNTGYYEMGLMRYLEQALAQAAGRR